MKKTSGRSAQVKARKDFLLALDTAFRIYGPAREMCRYNYESFESTYQPNVAAKVIGLAFLSAVAAWEDYVSNIYLGYLSGYPAENGYVPKLRVGPAKNKTHALLLAAGEGNERDADRRMRWSSFQWIRKLSEVHFSRENVFQQVTDTDLKWLDLAQIIRNRVAHNSDKAKLQFKVAVNRLVDEPVNASLPPGFSPGWFLSSLIDGVPAMRSLYTDDYYWGDIFEGYISLWRRLAYDLCPASK
jgi:hypothetical protein